MFGPPLNRDYLGHIERMRRLDNERDEAAYRRDSEHKARIAEANAYGRRKAELEAERAASRLDRAMAAREVEALLRRVRHVHTKLVEPEYDMTDDDGVIRPRTAADLAALVVDAVLVEAFDRHTTDQLARSDGQGPLFHLSLPLDVDLMHAISRGVTRERQVSGLRRR